jgi:hypothetical protein
MLMPMPAKALAPAPEKRSEKPVVTSSTKLRN